MILNDKQIKQLAKEKNMIVHFVKKSFAKEFMVRWKIE